jgi:hypothetical protein
MDKFCGMFPYNVDHQKPFSEILEVMTIVRSICDTSSTPASVRGLHFMLRWTNELGSLSAKKFSEGNVCHERTYTEMLSRPSKSQAR